MAQGRVSERQLAIAKAALDEGMGYKEAAAKAGMSFSTLYFHFPIKRDASTKGRPPKVRDTAQNGQAGEATPATPVRQNVTKAKPGRTLSHRVLILKAIREKGPFDGIPDLMAAVGSDLDLHSAAHLLHSLKKAGLITFNEVRKPGAATGESFVTTGIALRTVHRKRRTTAPVAAPEPVIEPVAAAPAEAPPEVLHVHEHPGHYWKASCRACMVYHPTGRPHERRPEELPAVAAAPPPPPPPVVEAVPTEPLFPLLDALRVRREQQREAAAKSTRYLEAAAILEGVDEAMYQHLLGLAVEVAGAGFTALEAEYLRFADEEEDEGQVAG